MPGHPTPGSDVLAANLCCFSVYRQAEWGQALEPNMSGRAIHALSTDEFRA